MATDSSWTRPSLSTVAPFGGRKCSGTQILPKQRRQHQPSHVAMAFVRGPYHLQWGQSTSASVFVLFVHKLFQKLVTPIPVSLCPAAGECSRPTRLSPWIAVHSVIPLMLAALVGDLRTLSRVVVPVIVPVYSDLKVDLYGQSS